MTAIDQPGGFALWLRAQMAEAKIGRRTLAIRAGVDRATITRLVNGERQPLIGTAHRIARALGVVLELGR